MKKKTIIAIVGFISYIVPTIWLFIIDWRIGFCVFFIVISSIMSLKFELKVYEN